jgi:hypothetical protein
MEREGRDKWAVGDGEEEERTKRERDGGEREKS